MAPKASKKASVPLDKEPSSFADVLKKIFHRWPFSYVVYLVSGFGLIGSAISSLFRRVNRILLCPSFARLPLLTMMTVYLFVWNHFSGSMDQTHVIQGGFFGEVGRAYGCTFLTVPSLSVEAVGNLSNSFEHSTTFSESRIHRAVEDLAVPLPFLLVLLPEAIKVIAVIVIAALSFGIFVAGLCLSKQWLPPSPSQRANFLWKFLRFSSIFAYLLSYYIIAQEIYFIFALMVLSRASEVRYILESSGSEVYHDMDSLQIFLMNIARNNINVPIPLRLFDFPTRFYVAVLLGSFKLYIWKLLNASLFYCYASACQRHDGFCSIILASPQVYRDFCISVATSGIEKTGLGRRLAPFTPASIVRTLKHWENCSSGGANTKSKRESNPYATESPERRETRRERERKERKQQSKILK